MLVVARRSERLRALAEEVGVSGGRLEPLIADPSTTAGVETLLARTASLDLELLVNNAGIATDRAFASTPAEHELELVRLNVEGLHVITVPPGVVRIEFAAVAGSQDPERRFPHLSQAAWSSAPR